MGEYEEELLEALQDMARQYLSDVDGETLSHDFIAAGENCLNVLTKFDRVETDDGIYYTWIEEN